MSGHLAAYVVDASVGAKLFLPEPLAGRAHALFLGLLGASPLTLHVPDLFFVECANVLWKHVRRGTFSASAVAPCLANLGSLPLHVTPTRDLFEVAFNLAVERHCTAYDACYLALARATGAPLVTADERLVRLLFAWEPPVVHLAELPEA
jgi:predicted nucleic acid-binding protein